MAKSKAKKKSKKQVRIRPMTTDQLRNSLMAKISVEADIIVRQYGQIMLSMNRMTEVCGKAFARIEPRMEVIVQHLSGKLDDVANVLKEMDSHQGKIVSILEDLVGGVQALIKSVAEIGITHNAHELQRQEALIGAINDLRDQLPLHAAALQNPDSYAIIAEITKRVDERLKRDDIRLVLRQELEDVRVLAEELRGVLSVIVHASDKVKSRSQIQSEEP